MNIKTMCSIFLLLSPIILVSGDVQKQLAKIQRGNEELGSQLRQLQQEDNEQRHAKEEKRRKQEARKRARVSTGIRRRKNNGASAQPSDLAVERARFAAQGERTPLETTTTPGKFILTTLQKMAAVAGYVGRGIVTLNPLNCANSPQYTQLPDNSDSDEDGK